MLRNAKIGRFISVTCGVWLQFGVLGFCVVTSMDPIPVQVGNETRLVHPMPCGAYKKILNVDESPTNEIVLASQFFSGAIVNTVAVAAYSVAAVFAAHACGQLDVLMTWINEFVNKTETTRKVVDYSEIGIIVEHHLRVLSFISRIEDIMQRICFMILGACTTDICMLCYYILTEWPDRNFQKLSIYTVILVAFTFNVFIMCYIGEILSEQCLKVGEVVYMTNWYHLPDKTVLDLILIIKRSSVTIKLTAGKIIYTSISTFGSVMKTAFAYVNFLRRTA
nr:odorant receptor 4-like [Nomia melanderi]